MSVAFTPKRLRISVDRYQKMVATGVLTRDDRVELIEGEMIAMAPIGPKHAAITNKLTRLLVRAVGDDAIVAVGGPVNLGEFSEPQPDLMLLKPRADFYASGIAESDDVLLLIEVSESSLAFDRGMKLALYARYGIADYWIFDVTAGQVEVYREPEGETYAAKTIVTPQESVSPLAFPALEIAVRDGFVQL